MGTKFTADVALTITSVDALEAVIQSIVSQPPKIAASVCRRLKGVLERSYQARAVCTRAELATRVLPLIRRAEDSALGGMFVARGGLLS